MQMAMGPSGRGVTRKSLLSGICLAHIALTGAFRMAAVETSIREGMPVAVFGDGEWLTSGIVPQQNFWPLQLTELVDVYRQRDQSQPQFHAGIVDGQSEGTGYQCLQWYGADGLP